MTLIILMAACLSGYLVEADNIAMFTDNLIQDYRSVIVNQTYYIDGILANPALVDRYESNKYCLLSTIATATQSQQSLVKSLIQYSNYTQNTFESKKVRPKKNQTPLLVFQLFRKFS